MGSPYSLDILRHAPFAAKFFIALPVPEIIATEVLGGLRTPNLGEDEAVRARSGMVGPTVRKSVGEFL